MPGGEVKPPYGVALAGGNGDAGCAAGGASFFLESPLNINLPINCSRLTELWVNFISPFAASILSSAPGTMATYFEPSRPSPTISAVESAGIFTALSTDTVT